MTQFSPLTGSILQSSQIARQQAINKAAQVRRSQQLQRNVAQRDDELEHQVESSEELTPTRDRDAQGQRKRQPPNAPQSNQDEGDAPHIDLTA